ncbi:MAG: DUF2179 domain-containing protein [Chloroflexi bacterium]|nr:DUF2179 domain-containing protein [Chloroflexota bacterium]
MVIDLSPEGIGFAVFIVILRILNTATGTVRLIIVTRQQRFLAAVLAFMEALMFAISIGSVANDLNNLLNLLAYCGGFAIGNYVGMFIEHRFITSFVVANVISEKSGHEIALALRKHGFGVTETTGEGMTGKVIMLRSVIVNREVPRLLEVVQSVQPDAFVAMEEARAVHRGWVRAGRNQQ